MKNKKEPILNDGDHQQVIQEDSNCDVKFERECKVDMESERNMRYML